MKKLSLLVILLCLLGVASNAATISGTVTNASTSAPIAGQKMYFYDAVTSYRDSTLTNTSGVYSIAIPASVPSFDSVKIYTVACGSTTAYYPLYTGSNLSVNFSICASAPTYMIHGTISLSGTSNTGLATVYLILRHYDTTAKTTILTAIDSIVTASTGGTYTKTYSSNPMGSVAWNDSLLLKVALQPSHPSYSSYVPTYYVSSLVWSGAIGLTYVNFQSAVATNITMNAGTNTGGPGFVGGSVLLGANKSAAVGDPLSSRILILTDNAGAPLAYHYSDAAGKFSFTNLAVGTYKIFGDVWGKSNPALTFTVTAAKPGITNIIFEESSKKFEGHFSTLGISSSALSDVTAYPNPAADHVSFTGLNSIGGSKTVVLSDITGAVLLSQSFDNSQQVSVSTKTLPSGVYLLQLQTEAGSASFRVLK